MKVTKEMHIKELQAQYGQFRFMVSMNTTKWGLKIMNGLVRSTKGQKVKNAINDSIQITSKHTKGHEIRTRVFRPEGTENEVLPVMVYFHGGGYMMGIPEMANVFYEDVLKKRKVAIISPDYRLSQKDPFPAGFNDYCAKQLNISPNYLSDLLKKETGKTTQEHLHLFVIERAKNSLLNSKISISQIAYSLGFEYPQHFSNLFKLKTGMSPKEYRSLN